MDSKSRSDGLLGPAPIGGGLQRTGMSSSWGNKSMRGCSLVCYLSTIFFCL